MIRIILLLMFVMPAPAQEISSPLPSEARGAILNLSMALSKSGAGAAELLRFSDLSARLSMTEGTVAQAEVESYARLAGELVAQGLAAKRPPLEAAAPLKLVADALASRLGAEDRALLERARDSLAEAGEGAVMSRAKEIASSLSDGKAEDAVLVPTPAPSAASGLRPAVEWWTVGERRYDSTPELLRDWKWRAGQEEPATYHFLRAEPKRRGRILSALGGGALGVGIGLVAGAVLAGVLGFLSAVGDLVAALAGGQGGSDTTGLALVLAPALIAGGIGLGLGWDAARTAQKNGETIAGRLAATEDLFGKRVVFSFGKAPEESVELTEHAQAATAQEPEPQGRFYDPLIGLGYMAAATAATFVPLFIGDLVSGGFAAVQHDSYSKRLGVPILQAGAAAALLLLAHSVIVSTIIGHGFWLLLGTALSIGALWGRYALPHLRAAEVAEKAEAGQWWSKAAAKDRGEAAARQQAKLADY